MNICVKELGMTLLLLGFVECNEMATIAIGGERSKVWKKIGPLQKGYMDHTYILWQPATHYITCRTSGGTYKRPNIASLVRLLNQD